MFKSYHFQVVDVQQPSSSVEESVLSQLIGASAFSANKSHLQSYVVQLNQSIVMLVKGKVTSLLPETSCISMS